MPGQPASPALSTQLLAAAQAIQAVLAGQSLSDSLARTPAAQRAAAQALSFHAMRHLGTARALRDRMIAHPPPNPLADALLLLGLCLLDTSLDQTGHSGIRRDAPVYAAHTVVDQAVEAAAHHARIRPYKKLINAVLRRFGRERTELMDQVSENPEAAWNHPEWWIRTLRNDWPDDWQGILRAANQAGPMTLRANARRNTPAGLRDHLASSGVQATLVGLDGLTLAEPRPVQDIPGFAEGLWSVQDLAAQQAGRLLPVSDGMRVLDACAAPGGKTAHLLERHDIALTALDSDPGRLARVSQNLDRLRLGGPNVKLLAADASQPDTWWDGQAYDAILADVPCTASGVVRRHPDIRWLRRSGDLRKTAALQTRILAALWPLLSPGGHLLYVTCSVFRIEGERQIESFLERHSDALRLDAPGHILPRADCAPATQGDGFFYALIAKRE